MRRIAYAHLLKPLSELADLCGRYNALSSPSVYRSADEHDTVSRIAREHYTTLRPYIALGIVTEWASGSLHVSAKALEADADVS
jgi:hypothetical protein